MDCDTGSRKQGSVVLTSTVERHILAFTQLFGRGNLHVLNGKIGCTMLEKFKLYLELVVHNVYSLYMCIGICVIMRAMRWCHKPIPLDVVPLDLTVPTNLYFFCSASDEKFGTFEVEP